MKTAVIIGAGIAGIATSIRLARKGYKVRVYEANSYAGGKLSAFVDKGYRFDAGPSLFTMPHLVTELFDLCGEDPSASFTYQTRSSVCTYYWEDGTRYEMPAAPERIAATMASTFDVAEADVLSYLSSSRDKYELTAPLFLERSLHKPATYLNRETVRALVATPRLGVFDTLHAVNSKAFADPRVVQLFDRYATYNGSDPYQTPGIMSMIPHLEMGIGTFFPVGGMVSITDSLVALAQRQGVEYVYNTPVQEIIIESGRAVGVVCNGERQMADVIVSNMDIFSTYRRLLPDAVHPEKILHQERSSSAMIFYWGIERVFDDLGLHNIFFADDYRGEFEAIFVDKELHDDPTVYIHISSKGEATDAPPGCENWFVMINTPGDFGQDWPRWIDRSRERIIAKLSRLLGVDIEPLIATESVLDPRGIESKTQSHRGALYGTASNNRFAAFLRHSNFSRQYDGLFFCGGSVHPGGGIPLCLSSAKIVADLIN